MPTARTEDRTSYYYNNGKRVALASDPEVFAVCFLPGRKSDDATLSMPARRFLSESEPVGFVPHYSLQIYRAVLVAGANATAAALVERTVRDLATETPIKFATRAVRRMEGDRNVSFLTSQFVVAFKRGVTQQQIDDLHTKNGVRVIERLGYVANGFLCESLSVQSTSGPVALSNTYYETGLCEFAHPDFVERRQWRNEASVLESAAVMARGTVTERNGDFISRQWHLAIAKVIDAWGITKGDSAVTIAVLDDGVDVAHPEFSGKLGPQFDFQNKVADASPKADDDKHGTACAGVAAAAGVKCSGAAPGCQLMAVRTPTMLSVADEANMFRWASDQGADVISCSWGPPDNAGPFSLVDNVRAAIRYCVTSGRRGKGIPVFFAAGNGNELVSDDGYATNPDIMAIAACSERDTHSPYSDFGPEIFVCAPSSGDAAAGDRRIFTTDRRAVAGYNTGNASLGDAAGDYTSRFGGTSSACPLVAGIAALVLSVDPTLTRDQVKDILKTTTDKIGGATAYDSAGHHAQFGFGRVNAFAAVSKAQGRLGAGAGTGPSISAPAMANSGSAPAFVVNRGARRFYAVELSTQRELFDPVNSGQRNASCYYESWSSGFSTDATWRPTGNVWSTLAAAGQVYYRAHFADDQDWSNYQLSASPSEAPVITISAVADSVPSLSVPNSVAADTPPVFRASFGGRPFYAVELATSQDLMDGSNSGSRTSSNYYGSWTAGMTSESTYAPPSDVWAALAKSERVYYRGHFASDTRWSNYAIYPTNGPLPSIQILGSDGASDSSSGATAESELTYPSGAIFRTVDTPQDGIDYSDPVANGVVPLIDVKGRESEQLSDNLQVKELMAKGARYARIAPTLVEAMQALRTKLRKPLLVDSGYRYPALNTTLHGDARSEHLAGRAAVVRSIGVPPTDVAKAALEAIEVDIGIGLGPTSVHIDVAGRFSTWVYQGAAMTDDQFASWARSIRSSRSTRSDELLHEVATRGRPTIDGPELLGRSDPAPTFRVNSGINRFFAIEVATDWRFFATEARANRTADTFYGTWGDPCVGLIEGSPDQGFVYTLSTAIWRQLGKERALYYRVLTVSERSRDWPNLACSTPDDQALSAPCIRLVDRLQALDDSPRSGLAVVLGSHALDDSLWDR